MANENRKLSRYLKRKLNLKEAQEEIEQMVKKKDPCHQKVNNHFSDNEISSNPQQSEQPSSEPVTCVLTSQFHEDEDPKNIAELKSKTSSQNSVAEGCESYDSDEQWTELVDAEFHGRNEYMDQIDELKKEISFLNEQIRNSTFDLEVERGDFDNKISEKDATILRLQEEVKFLKEMNPLALAKSLNEGLVILQSTLETLTM